MEEGAGSSGSVPHPGMGGPRNLGCCFGDQLPPNVTGSRPPIQPTECRSPCPQLAGLSFHWQGLARKPQGRQKWEAGCQEALAQVNQLGGQGREMKSLQPHHFASIHITHQIRKKMAHICSVTQGRVSMATITPKFTPDSCNSRS